MTVKGIDVATFQKKIDWNKVKIDGIQFAILRGGYGRYEKDEYFETNYKNAKAVGMPVGVYHYTYANTVEKAKAEANFTLSYLKGKKFEYPIAFDIEDSSIANLSKSLLTQITKTYCDIVQAAGYYVVIYASKYWLTSKLDMNILKNYDVWVAQYNDKVTYTGSYGMWQYSSEGKVDGISGRVDMDYAYKDYPTIMKKNGLNGYTKAAPAPVKKKDIDTIAHEVIADKWGDKTTKPTRKERLEAAGYNYDQVQARVTLILNKRAQEEAKQKKIAEAKKKAEEEKKKKEQAQKYAKGAAFHVKNQPLYASATAKSAQNRKTGTYYLYDGEKVNGRYRVTVNRAFCGKKPMGLFVTGWMEL